MDPFAATSDPDAYVPRPACERVLRALEAGVSAGQRVLVLSGPPGLGKTLLLRVLEKRLAVRARCLFLSYAAFEWEELCRFAVGLAGEGTPAGGEGEARLATLARAEAAQGRTLLLLIDDASALPLEVARRLSALAETLGGALRVVAASVDDSRSGGVVAALGDGIVHVRLRAPMSAAETRIYVAVRLSRARAEPRVRRRFHHRTVAWMHRVSAGNPRALHALAAWVLHPEGGRPELPEAQGDGSAAEVLDSLEVGLDGTD